MATEDKNNAALEGAEVTGKMVNLETKQHFIEGEKQSAETAKV